ncbi:hypothetical protein BGZ82_002519 [Podila clonocystis]|nr:hypothetical protein BGZ82_002519 [Podila clonocystis]
MKKKIALAKFRNSLLSRLQLATIPYETISLHWRPVLQSADKASLPQTSTPNWFLSRKAATASRTAFSAMSSRTPAFDQVTAKIVCDIKVTAKRTASLVGEGANSFKSEELAQTEVMPTNAPGCESHRMLLVALPSSLACHLVDIGMAKHFIWPPIFY